MILAVVALVGLLVLTLFRRDLRAARGRLSGRSDTLETTAGTLEYAVVGAGEPGLLLHGAGGGFDQALDFAGALSDRPYRLITPSRFGYLRSAMPAGATTALQADVYVDLLDRLGVQEAFVAGVSAGAWSALQLALRHPERCRALVLFVPADYLPPGVKNYGGVVARALMGSDLVAWAALKLLPLVSNAATEALLGTRAELVRAAEPAERQRIASLLEHLLPVGPRTRGMRFDVRTAAARSEELPLEEIRCPVLAVSAEDDAFQTAGRAREIAGRVPHGRALVYPSGGHALVGRYPGIAREVASFLATVPGRG